MTSAAPHLPLLAALAQELARSGVRHAVVCPGSRNAPIALALDAEPGLTCWSALDERAAGFLALGIAKATGTPAAVCVTSGTAVSNLGPATIEAHEAGVPLLLLTADRPAELRDVGAGQTIDQLRVLDQVTRWTVEADLGEATVARDHWVRATTCRAVAVAGGAGGRPGPVQLNLPLREPLTAPGPHAALTGGRPGGAPWLAVHRAGAPDPHAFAALAARCMGAQRGVIVAGRSERSPELSVLLPRLAALLDWPLLADPMSGARRGPHAIAAYDLVAGTEDGTELVPDLVLRAGDLPVSKPLRSWLAGVAAAAPQLLLTPETVWADPDAVAAEWIQGDPARVVRALITAIGGAREGVTDDEAGVSERGWMARWQAAERIALADDRAVAITGAGDDAPLTESLVAHTLASALPADATIVVGASLPVRLLERWAPVTAGPPRVLSNRGANGIDGVVSTAFGALAGLGAASAAPGVRGAAPASSVPAVASGTGGDAGGALPQVVAYLGDLTLLYDQGGLAAVTRLGLPLQLVVVNNHGGRIFDRLQVATDAGEALVPLITTPHEVDLTHLAAFHGLELHRPTTRGELAALLALAPDRARLIEVLTT